MDIKSIKITPLHIPFKVSFKHSSAERKLTQSILVIVESRTGNIGYGEGCPREYVTNESIESCMHFFSAHESQIKFLHNFEALEQWVHINEEIIDKNPAAWCAIELALLDLISKENFQSVEKTLGLSELSGTFQFTAVLGDSSPDVFQGQVKQYAAMGFSDFKLKISGDAIIDNKKLEILSHENIEDIRLRFDANNLWTKYQDVLNYLSNVSKQPFAIEEPLHAFDFTGLSKITENYSGKIILDESFLYWKHFSFIKNHSDCFIINLRISKMGGIIRSLKIAREADRLGIPIIIGAQVGETSILTRAALTVANAYRNNLLAQEGAYGTILLERDIVSTPLMFGKKGILEPSKFLREDFEGFSIKF